MCNRVPVDGTHLADALVGNGPDTVVVLHGGPALHSGYLIEPFRPLATKRTLIFYDARGPGRSESVVQTRQLSMDRDVEDLEQLRTHFHLSRIRLLAHHWGAMLALSYAVRYP